jgi:hypothetical protein
VYDFGKFFSVAEIIHHISRDVLVYTGFSTTEPSSTDSTFPVLLHQVKTKDQAASNATSGKILFISKIK